MKMSEKGLALIRKFEGFEPRPYKCPAGKWTIGFGSTYYQDGKPVAEGDAPITVAQGLDLLQATLGQYEDAVSRCVTVPLTSNEFDALVDFAYNVGVGNLKSSTLLKHLNAGNYGAAADQFLRWDKANGVSLPGLVKRRAAEKALFLGMV